MVEPSTGTPDAEIEVHDDDAQADEPEATLVEEDLLVEDVSIDGMCGVY
jgi:mycofactocin precursor